MNALLIEYASYLGVALTATAGTAVFLWKQSRAVLVHVYQGHLMVADPLIRLQGVGYFLINACNIVFAFGLGPWPANAVDAADCLCLKIGWVLLVLTGTYYWRLERVEEVYREFILRPAPPTLAN